MKLSHLRFLAVSIMAIAAVALSGLNHQALAASATLYLTPSSGTYSVGQTLTVTVYTNTGGDPVNAVEADFSYPSSKLQFQSIDTGSSAFGISAPSSGGSGTVQIARGNTSGISGTLIVAAVHFTVLATGSAAMSFQGSSAVVRSTDNANILSGTTGANFTLSAAATPPPSTPKPSTPASSGSGKTATPKPTSAPVTPQPASGSNPTSTPASGSTSTPVPVAGAGGATTPSASPAPSKSSTKVLGLAAIGLPILALLALGAFMLNRSHVPQLADHGSDQNFTLPPAGPVSPAVPPSMPSSPPAPPAVPPASPTSTTPPAAGETPPAGSPNQTFYPDSNSKHDGPS